MSARHAALAVALAMLPPGTAVAHDLDAVSLATVAAGEEFALDVRVDLAEAVPRVVTVPLGAHVRMSVGGAGELKLHLHGYDVEAVGVDGPAVIEFYATHEGRFPLEAHIEDDLLGRRAKPVLFVEVHAP